MARHFSIHLRCVLPWLLCGFVVWIGIGCGGSKSRPDAAVKSKSPAKQIPAGKAAEDPTRELWVGMETCARCHADKMRSHRLTGHAQTFHQASADRIAEKVHQRSADDPRWETRFHYEQKGDALRVKREGVHDPFPLQFALGSGAHALTFLTLIQQEGRATIGLEHRISWFSDDHLGLTPGHRDETDREGAEMFGRIIPADRVASCIGCHVTTARIEKDEVVDLRPNVNCESCHGPGRRHVELVESGTGTGGIQFASRNRHPVKEVEMCGRCHRLPQVVDGRLLKRENPRLTRFQPVGLMQSACFVQSGGMLSCSTCHDPHRTAKATTRRQYEAKCVACHQKDDPGTSLFRHVPCKVSPGSDCVRCHMPPVEVHPGLTFHDHWIRVRDENDPPAFTLNSSLP